ncbi:Yip1 family protein [Aquipseudomonas ullengensis]|uniref:YIP1 family protein n=1 Tax=Aquipseudomonas ullengensis TaxID=2759166 RepID=A0A7W4LL39_9GAMM|nr:Yip1 family protein [Pseudomonas ullengensis]MBB2495131.1 YIP1 family protein [Pseudomonas ullengensis]
MAPHFVTLFTRPDDAWHQIRSEEEHNSAHYLGHLFLLALIPAVSLFIGTTEVGWSLAENEQVTLDTRSALLLSITVYLTGLLGTLIMGGFIRWLSRTFDARPTFNQCIGFAAYTATPLFLSGLAALYPSRWLAVAVLGAACAYSTFLLFVGLPTFMRLRQEQAMVYSGSVWAIGVLVLVTLLVSAILHWQFYMQPTYKRTPSADQSYPTHEERPSVERQQEQRE